MCSASGCQTGWERRVLNSVGLDAQTLVTQRQLYQAVTEAKLVIKPVSTTFESRIDSSLSEDAHTVRNNGVRAQDTSAKQVGR